MKWLCLASNKMIVENKNCVVERRRFNQPLKNADTNGVQVICPSCNQKFIFSSAESTSSERPFREPERETVAVIVVPCYNEENRLKTDEFRNFIFANQQICFIFVNDGSSDHTEEVLKKTVLGTSSRIVNLPRNKGKAEAVYRGMLEAVKFNCICGFWDADLATPLSEIPFMIDQLQKSNYQCVIGSRWLHLGSSHIKRSFFRHIISRLGATVISHHLDLPIYDSQCGAKIFSAEAVRIVFQAPFVTKWLFDVEIVKRLQRKYGHKTPALLEYPISCWEEKNGSKISFFQVLIDFFILMRS